MELNGGVLQLKVFLFHHLENKLHVDIFLSLLFCIDEGHVWQLFDQVDLLMIAIVCVLSLLFFALAWGHLGYATFDEEMAKVDGIRSRILEYLLFAIAGVVVAVSALVVGVILIAAYLVIPAAAARLLSRSLIEWTIISLGIGVITTFLGLIMSFILDVPSGSTIVLSQALTFILAIFFGKLRA